MDERKKEMYDIKKNPEKYNKDLHFDKIYRNENNYVFTEFRELEYRGLRITFILNEKKNYKAYFSRANVSLLTYFRQTKAHILKKY